MMADDESPVLLYDGLCGFCDRTVQVVLRADPHGRIRFATLQGEFARRVLDRHPELHAVDSLVLVRSDGRGGTRLDVRSDAALALAGYMTGLWRVATVFRVVPRFVRDAAYDLFARHRYRAFGRRDTCRIPLADQRARFLD